MARWLVNIYLQRMWKETTVEESKAILCDKKWLKFFPLMCWCVGGSFSLQRHQNHKTWCILIYLCEGRVFQILNADGSELLVC